METGGIIQEPVSAMISEGASEYLLSKQAETVRNDEIERTPGLVDHTIKAHEVKIVPDESNGHNGSNGVTIDGKNFSGSADASEVPNGSGNKENEGAERVNKRAEREKEAAMDNNPVVETPEIAKEKASEAEKEAGNSDAAFDKQVSNFVEATSVCNEETTVHEPAMVSIAESLNKDDHGDSGKAQPVETISKINDEERILDDATVDSKMADEMTGKTEEMHESSMVIGEAVNTEKQTVQQELHSIEGSLIHVEEMVESSGASMGTPPVNIKEEMVRSRKEGEIEENSNQAHEELQTSSTNKDTEGHILEESMAKDETIVTETEAVDSTTAAEKESFRNAETIVNETKAVDTTAEEEKISKNAETILDVTEAVHIRTAAEEKSTKYAQLLDEGETTKGHPEPEENLTEEGEETREIETETVQTTAAAEEEIPRNAETIVNETEVVDTTTAEEEKISKNVEMLQKEGEETRETETETVQTTAAAEEKIPRNAETIVNETEAVDTTTAEEEKISKNVEMFQKEGEETREIETETVQITAAAEEEIPRNAETIVNETEAVDTTTAEEENISKNVEMILDTTEAAYTTTAVEEKIAKDPELLDEGETTKEDHLEPEDSLTEENRTEMHHKEGEETIANETEAVQITAVAEEKISKNAETVVDAIDTAPTTTAAEENILKYDELLNEGETAKEGNLESDENPTEEKGKEMLHKEGKEIKEDKEQGLHVEEKKEEEGEAEVTKNVILSEEAPTEVDKADDIEYIKDKITGKDTGAQETDDEVKSLDQVSGQTVESAGYTEPSSGIKDQTQKRDESFEVNSKNLLDATGQESLEKLEEKGQESQACCERNEAATEIAVVTERSEGETQVCEQLLDESSTQPEGKILQQAEPETIQVTKEEGFELEESPSGTSLKVQTEDHGSEDKAKLTKDSLKMDEVAENDIAPEVFIPSKDHVAEEADRTGESQITGEQRFLASSNLEVEKNYQNNTWCGASEETKDQETIKTDETLKGPLEKPVAIEDVGLGKTTHDQTLPEVESIEQMEKASLQFPSEGSEQTTETVDAKIEEKPQEAGLLDQEGQEEGSCAVKTKEEICPPLESKELGERTQEERSADDPIPLQEEISLSKEQVDETLSQKEQTKKHESRKEEIPDDQQTLGEEKSDEHKKIPPALPSNEQEQGALAEVKKIEEGKVKEAEPAADRSQESHETSGTLEPNGVPSLPVELSEADENPSSELVSELDEQTPKQVEQILEEERKEADEIKAEKVPSSEHIPQEISEKQAPASALVSEEEEQVTASDAVMIHEAKGEDEVTERNESQEEFPNAAETEESVFSEEEQHGDPGPSKNDQSLNDQDQPQEQLQILPSEESKMITTDTSENLQDNLKEGEEGPQELELSSKDTDAADRGVPLEELSMPNKKIKASDGQIQIPSDLGESETLEGSELTKVTEDTADQSLLEEKPDEQVESTLEIKQEETLTEETKEGDKETNETERTVALEGSGTSEKLEIRQEELRDLEAPKLEDKEEDKNQKSPGKTEIPEAQADHCLPVETSEPDHTPSSEFVPGLYEQTPKQVEEIHEVKTKEADELQAGETIPRESSNDKAPTSVLASGEEEQATASDSVKMQESKSEDEVKKRNEGQEEGPATVETEDKKGETKAKESEEEAKEKLECSDAEEVTGTPADQSHIEEQSDDQVETPSYALSLEKQVQEVSTEATEIEDEDTKKTNTGITETEEGQSMSNTLENVCLNQEELKDLGAPKQDGITEDQTLKGESPDDASFLKKTGETEHGVDPSSTLPDVQATLQTEREIRDAPSSGETLTMEPAEQTQKAGDAEVESNEKDIEPSIKQEDTETEGKHPVTEITDSVTVEKQDMKEAEEASSAEMKQESSLQQDERGDTEKIQARNAVEEQSLPENELNLQKKITEVVEIQEEQTREFEASVEEKTQDEETREIVEREEEISAGQSISEALPGEKIQIPSSVLSSEELEHALSTEKQEDKTEESALPRNESHEDSRPEDMTETLSDQNMPEETPDEQVQTQSTNLSTEKLAKETQIEVMKEHEGERKEGEETVAKAQQDANAAAFEKACLQEKHPTDPEISKKVGDTSASLAQETEQKPDSPEPVEGENVDIIEGKKNQEIQDEKPEDPFATRQKAEAFSPEVKTDHGDATQRGTHHDLTSSEVEKEEPQSALLQELREKADDADFRSNEETVELHARTEDTKSEEKHHVLVAADLGITGEKNGEKTEEAPVAEATNEECSQQEQSKETDIFTAEKSTNDLNFPTEQTPKDQIEEVKIQEEQPKELEARIEEILADKPLKKDAHIEQIQVPTSALPSEEQEHVAATGKHENKAKEYETALDEPDEGQKAREILADQDSPEEKPGDLIQAQSSELPLEEPVLETSFEVRQQDDENKEALAGRQHVDDVTTKANISVQDQPQDFGAPRRDEDTSGQIFVAEESAKQLTGPSTSLPSHEQGQKSNDLSPVQEDKGTDTKVKPKDEIIGEDGQEEPSAREQRKETSLSEEKKEPQDMAKHGVNHGLNSQTAEAVEEPQQLSSALASEDNKHDNKDTATEIEEKTKEDSENLKEKSTSEASDASLTEPTIQSMEANPRDGPTVAPDNVMKIQAPEMIERDEILQKEVAREENNVTSENSDQISHQEATNQIYKENEETDVATALTRDIPKEEKLSGGKEEISAEKKIGESMLLLESLPAKANMVLAEKEETAQGYLDVTKGTDEETKEIKPKVQKIEIVSFDSRPQDACSKIEEQETETSQEGCPSQPKEITEEVRKLGKTIPVILDKEIPVEETLPQQKINEDLQKIEGEVDGAGNIKGSSSEVKETEHVEKKMNNLDEKVTEYPTSRESARNSLSDLLQKVKEVKETKTGEEGTLVKEAKTDKVEDTEASHIEEAKTEEEKDEEEDGDEHKEDKTSPDSVVMVEARDLNVQTPHKKQHGILSGVGSKVKHSISKVKKAITGKSSHTKPVSPK